MTEERLALLKILVQSNKNLEEGNVRPVDKSFKGIRARIKEAGLNDHNDAGSAYYLRYD